MAFFRLFALDIKASRGLKIAYKEMNKHMKQIHWSAIYLAMYKLKGNIILISIGLD